MNVDDEILISSAAYVFLAGAYLLRVKKKPRKRRCWMISVDKSREMCASPNLLKPQEILGGFNSFCRMSSEDFECLLNRVGPKISKRDTNMRKAIPAQERLAITLRFLASGDSFEGLCTTFKISPQSISNIIPEVCVALMEVLKDEIKVPQTIKDWKNIAEDFEKKLDFPHCCGALGGKHIIIRNPFNNISKLSNNKDSYSILLMAIVDANYCFTLVDAGYQCHIGDSGVLQNTALFKNIEEKQLRLPPDEHLSGRDTIVPYMFAAEDSFPLSSSILGPYPEVHNTEGTLERIFNNKISLVHQIVEKTFDILGSVFQVLQKPLLLQPEKATAITMTCVLLHNFLMESNTSKSIYAPCSMFDSEIKGEFSLESWRDDPDKVSSLVPLTGNACEPSNEACNIRREFAEYFMINS